MFGIGKPRTALGKYLDRKGLSQGWLETNAGLNKNSVTKLCSDLEYQPRAATVQKIISALRREGHDVRAGDFW